MKKVFMFVVVCFLAGVMLSSCGSSKPCPAYRSVASMEQPASTDQPS